MEQCQKQRWPCGKLTRPSLDRAACWRTWESRDMTLTLLCSVGLCMRNTNCSNIGHYRPSGPRSETKAHNSRVSFFPFLNPCPFSWASSAFEVWLSWLSWPGLSSADECPSRLPVHVAAFRACRRVGQLRCGWGLQSNHTEERSLKYRSLGSQRDF